MYIGPVPTYIYELKFVSSRIFLFSYTAFTVFENTEKIYLYIFFTGTGPLACVHMLNSFPLRKYEKSASGLKMIGIDVHGLSLEILNVLNI